MNKDEILLKSRKENKLQDERTKEVYAKAGNMAAKIGGLVCALILFFNTVIAGKEINYDGWAIYCSIYGTMWLISGVHLRKKTDLLFGVVIVGFGIINFVLYLKTLFG